MPAILDIPPNHFLPHPFGPSILSSASKQRLIDRAELSRWQGEVSSQQSCSNIAPEMARIGVAVASSLPHHYGGYSHPRHDIQAGVERKNVTTNTNSWREDTTQQRQAQRHPLPLISQHSNINQESSSNSPVKSTASSVSSPQLTSSMTGNGGNLAEFAAQVACLFWFAKASKLKQIEDGSSYTPTSLLELEFAPSPGFKKWVTTVLTTTQVSKNVILLALLFIYRLKKFNPAVRGKRGSEFRLMTIALMMGNKFLDDNTYTNKTWAEVSGISVQEIHVMEVEFLSNVRYNLFVTKESSSSAISKRHRDSNWTLLGDALPYDDPTIHSAMSVEPLSAHRKRSWDEQVNENPAKRPATATTGWVRPSSTQASVPLYQPSQLPTTSLALPQTQLSTNVVSISSNMTSQLPRPHQSYAIGSASTPATLAPLTTTQPLSTGPRPTIFSTNHTSARWSQPPASQPSLAPLPVANLQQSVPTGFSDPSRRTGPTTFPTATSATTISPAVPTYSVRTPTHLSPSSILLDRNSPYRPVRSVNTLLYPPPAGSLLQPRQLSVELMRYQPLGKRNSEDRAGVLPYSQPNIWGEQYFSQVQPTTQATPYHQG
ncbi:conserved hypothetical protein [Microsporum canis CBS 113480]|uniref:Mucin n=1 Tax=Arthroderma otae (strain ATCC MYA-4605 / CBS 113480) TaxID=554155 RepID=C5FJQ0_ARTOC|nr:conserved hypothetical protein [Microsporum canis CBS 113480]EEQ30911.1 conserved hypothetical protein [Microsporum canis CBS 113480]